MHLFAIFKSLLKLPTRSQVVCKHDENKLFSEVPCAEESFSTSVQHTILSGRGHSDEWGPNSKIFEENKF